MKELMEKFAEARFGKKAFLGRLFGGMDPKKKAIRDRIEDMIREEQQKRDEAKASIKYGKNRIETAGAPSTLGWASDIARALIPGMSISADTAKRMVKIAQGETPADSKLGGRAFDLAHLGAAGAGAGVGAGIQRGSFGGFRGASALRDATKDLGPELSKALGGSVGKALTKADLLNDVALAAQRKRIPGLTRLSNYFSPKFWGRKFSGGGAPMTAADAFKRLPQGLGLADDAATGMKQLSSAGAKALSRGLKSDVGRNIGGKVLKAIKPKGKLGALLGALVVSSPFIAARLWKTRGLRASGGTAGQEAARKAEELLGGAEKLRTERQQLMTQLA